MGTLADKASKVLDTKQQIAAAIEEKTGKNPGNVFADYPDAIRAIPTGGSGWTGHADAEGLKAIGWTDDDIAYYQEHGVNWNEEDDQYHLVPEDNKALYGVINIDNIQQYKDILVYLPKIDTTGVTSMSNKFKDCYSLVAVPMMNTSNVTTMNNMFQNCHSLVSVPLFDTSKVTNIIGMFYGCYSLIYVPMLDTSSVTNISNMFINCYSLVSVPLFDTSMAIVMQTMFQNCYSLVSVPLFDTSKVTNMRGMFINCYSLVSVPQFDTAEAIDMATMFNGCYSLENVYGIDAISTQKNIGSIINSCNSLRLFNMKNLNLPIAISATSLLEKSSLLYIIENAAPTSAITITLSAYCYNKFSNDSDVVAALSGQPLVSLASV